MTTPIIIGWQQLVLFLVAVVGLGLLISSAMGLSRGHIEKYVDEGGVRRYRHRRGHVRIGRGIGGVVLLILAVSLLWLTFLIQSYLGFTGDVLTARVRASQIEGLPHTMSVELTLYDSNGHQTSDKTYLVKGDRWRLEGNILKFPTWLNILGVHSAYKLTRLEGSYEDPNLEANEKHTVIVLNGGDGDFFKSVYKQAWSSPFVDAAYGGGTFEPADGMSYNVFVSQTGFYPKPATK